MLNSRSTSPTRADEATACPPRRLVLGLVMAGMLAVSIPVYAVSSDHQTPADRAALAQDRLAPEVRSLAAWIDHARDSRGAPFIIVDKRNARVIVFDGAAHMLESSPVLLGAARGDDSVPGIGERKIADIKPFERTTPAGRFLAEPGRNVQGEDIVWIDYDAAVSMHRVRATNPRERRLERLATPTVADNRISYGCINVPAAFFDAYVSPVFANGKQAVVYVLPETRSLRQVFRGYDADEHALTRGATPSRGTAVSLSR